MDTLPITQHQAEAFASGLNRYAQRLRACDRQPLTHLDYAARIAGRFDASAFQAVELANGIIVLNDAYALVPTSAGYLATTINPASLLATSDDLGMVSF